MFRQKLRADLLGEELQNASSDSLDIKIDDHQSRLPSGKVFLTQDIVFSGFVKTKTKFSDFIFMYGTFFIGILVTISTFIWGIL